MEDVSLLNEKDGNATMRRQGESKSMEGWELALEWLRSLSPEQVLEKSDIDKWLEQNQHELSHELKVTPRIDIYSNLQAELESLKLQRRTEDSTSQAVASGVFERKSRRNGKPITEKWRPVYVWLQALKQREVVKAIEITAWLEANPDVGRRLRSSHTNEHVFNYIQKCHSRMLIDPKERSSNTKRNKKQKDKLKVQSVLPGVRERRRYGKLVAAGPSLPEAQPSLVRPWCKRKRWAAANNEASVLKATRTARSELQVTSSCGVLEGGEQAAKDPSDMQPLNFLDADFGMDQGAAHKRFEILVHSRSGVYGENTVTVTAEQVRYTKLVTCGTACLPHRIQLLPIDISAGSADHSYDKLNCINVLESLLKILFELHKELVGLLRNFDDLPNEKMTRPDNFVRASPHPQPGSGGLKARDPMTICAWSFSEALSDTGDPVSGQGQSNQNEGEELRIRGSDKSANHMTMSLLKCLTEREQGSNSATVAFRPHDVGSHGRRWTSFIGGWNSLENQFQGPVSWLQQKASCSWNPSWCAYTSSVAIAPVERVDQGVQKVLDLRLHPGGLPQLVCSCNAAPNELLLYNLVNGRARELAGHNCQIQAVEYALDGERIISCGTNVLKVWDSSSGTCLYTLGPMENEGTTGHKKKISAMSVQQSQSCLVATSGGEGESEILLWNVRTGELASDLNAELRQRRSNLPSMDALKFCDRNLLICGSDSADSQPAVMQIWDVDAVKDLMMFPASDSYITCLNTDPRGSIIITGAGDGSVGLFDLRTGGAITRLPLGLKCEATSVAFSACGTFFHSSSTANYTLVWDTRMMPMEPGLMPQERPVAVSMLNSRSSRPLHCLSHGNPMPTTQNAGQLPGYVDEGDGGVNDAHWCQSVPVLVTASGNGSVALWDVTLGQPCVRLLSSHSRCINTVAISSNDQLICSGGDDQKVVLYHRATGDFMSGWRLTHPLSEELQPAGRSD